MPMATVPNHAFMRHIRLRKRLQLCVHTCAQRQHSATKREKYHKDVPVFSSDNKRSNWMIHHRAARSGERNVYITVCLCMGHCRIFGSWCMRTLSLKPLTWAIGINVCCKNDVGVCKCACVHVCVREPRKKKATAVLPVPPKDDVAISLFCFRSF